MVAFDEIRVLTEDLRFAIESQVQLEFGPKLGDSLTSEL